MRIPLLFLAAALVLAAPAQQPAPVRISVDAAHPTGPYTAIWNNFGADEPNYSYTPNGTQLLRELAAIAPAAPVSFRPHNLLTSGDGTPALKWGSTGVYTENPDGTPHYDWTITDRLFDNLAATHIRPLVEIGFMPEALSAHPQPYQHTFPNSGTGDIFTGWSYPPNNYAKWRSLIVAWATHLRARYGPIVETWQWEVWNEPDIGYFHGSPQDYFKLYDISTAAVRQVLPHALVGGPSVTGGGDNKHFLRLFLEHCDHGINADTGQPGVPLDFLSFHPKGSPKLIPAVSTAKLGETREASPRSPTKLTPTTKSGAPGLASETREGSQIPPEENLQTQSHVRMNLARQLALTDLGFKTIAAFPRYRSTPIYLTESDPEGCAACKGPQNGYRNGPLYGVSVAEMLVRSAQLAHQEGVNLAGVTTWAFEFEAQPPFAGFRELATNAPLTTGASALLDKPVLNVFRLFAHLHGSVLPLASSAALPLDQVADDRAPHPSDITGIATRDLSQSHPSLDILLFHYNDEDLPAPSATLTLEIQNLPATQVQVTRTLVDATHANAYTAWQSMGSPQVLTPAQLAQLQQSSRLRPTVDPATHKSRSAPLTLNATLPLQGVLLLHLTWKPAKP